MIIYKTTNLINGKIYVGKDCNNNPKYLGSGKILKQAIKKYGQSNFKKETIEECDGSNWIEREKYWIKELNARNPKVGYNILAGGDGVSSEDVIGEKNPMFGKVGEDSPSYGRHLSEEAKLKLSEDRKGENNPNFRKVYSDAEKRVLSEKLKGRPKSLATRLKMIQNHAHLKGEKSPLFGKPKSLEHRLKISQNHADFKGENSPLFGIPLPEEQKRKISESIKRAFAEGRIANNSGKNNPMSGRHHSKETIEKLKETGMFGKKHTEKTKEKLKEIWRLRNIKKVLDCVVQIRTLAA